MEKPISSSRKSTVIAARGAAYLVFALALSYLETLIPLNFIPLPGFKIGLANIIITIAFFRDSPFTAGAVSLAKVIVTSLLFGGAMSLVYSLCGAALSFLSLVFCAALPEKKLSFVGVSVICAAFHNLGQLLCAAAFYGFGAVTYYAPMLIPASLVFGTLTGVILCALPERIFTGKIN